MTAKQAILNECRWCNNTLNFRGCASEICKLNDTTINSSVKRIKAHCLTCVPEQNIQGVRLCDGKVMNLTMAGYARFIRFGQVKTQIDPKGSGQPNRRQRQRSGFLETLARVPERGLISTNGRGVDQLVVF